MPYQFLDHTGDIAVAVTGATLDELFAAAALAFTDTMTPLAGVEPRRPEELNVAAPELDLLLVDFLSELLYRFDTRGWITARAEVGIREQDGGWTLEGTLHGERIDSGRHPTKVLIKAVTYHGLELCHEDGVWRARLIFDI